MICPCKGCEDRYMDLDSLKSCHASCEKYQAWRGEKQTRVEGAVLRNRPSEFLIDMCRKQRRKSNKRKRK